jgi:RNA polymerase sigma-70 factor (ECF subfamily)
MFLMTKPVTADVATRHAQMSFREVVETHKRAVYYLALNLTGNHHDAEDLSQEVFIKAHRGLKEFRGDAQMYTWLRRIAVNTYLNKKRKKALAFFRVFPDDDESDRSPSAGPAPDATADAEFLRRRIGRALEMLTARERTAFVLRHHHELSVREVAASMDVADGTVKSLLFRATRKLQKELAPLQAEIGPGS